MENVPSAMLPVWGTLPAFVSVFSNQRCSSGRFSATMSAASAGDRHGGPLTTILPPFKAMRTWRIFEAWRR